MAVSFSYDNRKYEIGVGLATQDGVVVPLLDENIGTIEYTNTINDIVHEGYVEYTDTDQRVDRFLDKMICYCSINFSEIDTKSDGNISKTEMKSMMPISFFVNNIGIMENSPGRIKYKIILNSLTWINSVKRVDYTNYGSAKESVFTIIQNILKQSGFNVDDLSFKNVGTATTMNYITNGNDDVITSLRYLLNKTYYSDKLALDSGVKGIVYDEYADMIRAFGTDSTMSFQKTLPVIVNQFETKTDPLFQTQTNLAFNVLQNKTDLMCSMITKVLYDYSIETNEFTNEKLTTDGIMQYYSSHSKDNRVTTLINEDGFSKQQMTWNNDINIYGDQIKNLTQYGSLILNTAGQIGIIPGWHVAVDIPIRDEMVQVDDKKIKEEVKNAYQALCGQWMASSVTNFINPQRKIFRQNISLMRSDRSPSTK